jgi:hypothetical protein
MQVDPISSISRRAAAERLQELREFYAAEARRNLARSEYLRLLGEAVDRFAAERSKNEALFRIFRREIVG